MKKRYLILICFLMFAAIAALSLRSLGIISKSRDEFVFDSDVKTYKFEHADFYIDVKDNNGDYHTVNVSFRGNGDKFVGTAYLPGYTNTEECFLSWKTDNDVVLEKRLKKYQSGEFNIAGDGYSAIFFIEADGKKYDFMLNTITCSPFVEAMFIDIDENECTIKDMNNDPMHNTSCYGKVSFGGKNEFISIKGRGNATWKYGEKKPYNITFLESAYEGKKKIELIDGIETSKWSLLANYADPSLLRNSVGYSIADNLGIGLKSEYCDVWMNGKYLGNYLITPKNDYKASKNGIILELDNYIDEEDPQFYLSGSDNNDIKSLLFTVKDNGAELTTEEIRDWMQNAWEAIEDFESEDYQNYIDIESWAKMYLLHELYKNFDVVAGSILMHIDSFENGGMLIAGPVWDLDNALGTTCSNPINKGIGYDTTFSGEGWYIDSLKLTNGKYSFLQELGRHESFKEKVREIYQNNYELFDNLLLDIDEKLNIISKSAVANFDKWDIKNLNYNNFRVYEEWEFYGKYPFKYIVQLDFYDYVVNLKAYIDARIKFLKDELG